MLPFARWYTPLGRLLLNLEQITLLGSSFGGQLQTLRGHWAQIYRNHLYVGTSWAGQSVWQRPVRGSNAFRPLRPFNDSLFDRYVREIDFLQQFDSWKWIVRGNNNKNRTNPILFLLLPQLTTKNLQITVKIQMFHIMCSIKFHAQVKLWLKRIFIKGEPIILDFRKKCWICPSPVESSRFGQEMWNQMVFCNRLIGY